MHGQRIALLLTLALTGCPKEAPPAPDRSVDAAAPPLVGVVFATRIVDLHYDSMGGPVVARAFPGARVKVTPYKADWVRVHLGREWLRDKDEGVILYAEKTAFSRDAQPLAPVPFAPTVHDAVPVDVRPAADNPATFAATICGDVQVVTPPGVVPAHVVQVHGGIELSGWANELPKRGERCNLRRVEREGNELHLRGGGTKADDVKVDAVPPDFVKADAGADALAPLLGSGKSVWWLVLDREKTQCHEWKFVRTSDDGAIMHVAPFQRKNQPTWAAFDLAYVMKPTLLMAGPHFTTEPLDKNPKAAREGGYRCGAALYYVGMRDSALRMSPIDPKKAVAWNPDDEERWYTTKLACEDAKRLADATLASHANAFPPGGVHWDCFGTDGETW